MSLSALAETARSLKATASRLEKRRILVEFLETLAEEEIGPAVLLLTGRILPDTDEAALNVGWATLQRALAGEGQTTLL